MIALLNYTITFFLHTPMGCNFENFLLCNICQDINPSFQSFVIQFNSIPSINKIVNTLLTVENFKVLSLGTVQRQAGFYQGF